MPTKILREEERGFILHGLATLLLQLQYVFNKFTTSSSPYCGIDLLYLEIMKMQ